MKATLTVEETAELLGISKQAVRVQIQRKILPFGQALPSVQGKGFRYIIPKAKVYEYLGLKGEIENEKK